MNFQVKIELGEESIQVFHSFLKLLGCRSLYNPDFSSACPWRVFNDIGEDGGNRSLISRFGPCYEELPTLFYSFCNKKKG